MYQKNNVINILLVMLFVIGSVLNYSQWSGIGSGLRLVSEFLIIICNIWNVNFKNYTIILPLVGIFCIYPILMISVGVYGEFSKQVILYSVYYAFYSLFLICSINAFRDNPMSLVTTIFWTLTTMLFLMMFIFKGVSYNVSELINSMLYNQRYGNNILTQRISMGFNNVNTLGMFAGFLVLIAVITHKNRSNLKNILIVLFSIFIILNSGSRTPILAVGISLVVYLVHSLGSKKIKFIVSTITGFFLTTIWAVFLYFVYFSNSLNTHFMQLDEFLSYRLNYSQMALSLAGSDLHKWLGIGAMSTSFIQQKLTGERFAIDSSLAYFLLTIGIVGFSFLLIYILYLYCMIVKKQSSIVLTLFVFYSTYLVMENILFIPNSAVSTFILTIIFAYMLSNKRVEEYNDR